MDNYNDYIINYFTNDIKRHAQYLQNSDIKDLKQELYFTSIEINNNKNYQKENRKNKQAYSRIAYINKIKNFVKKLNKDKKMFKNLQEVYEALKYHNYNIEHTDYMKLDILETLSKIEKRVTTLRYTGLYNWREIIDLIGYKGTEAGLKKMIVRIKQKLKEKNTKQRNLDTYSRIIGEENGI